MSFLWYDLETFGQDPRRTRIAQFAAQRTDENLDPIGEPQVLFCRPADDLLPSPTATLITGITPQQALRDGVCEAEFIATILDEMMVPQTCSVGFNSYRFDDEFIRHSAWRSFHDPYEREWRNGNSRWDLLDVLRLAYALRPEGIVWPRRAASARPATHTDAASFDVADSATANGIDSIDPAPASFKLTDLTAANGISHANAHDALADVEATIAMARLLRRAQPRLFDYALKLRDKRHAASLCDIAEMTPVLHVSGRYPGSRRHAALVAPICRHPQIDNQVIAFDLDADPQPLLELDADDIADRLYTPRADLPEGVQRIPLKQIHLNRGPMLVELAVLRPPDFQRLQIDPELARRRAAILRAAPGLAEKLRRVHARAPIAGGDVDAAIYEGFVADADKRLFAAVRASSPAALPAFATRLRDPRLPEMLFRHQARNWPESLDAGQRQRWDDYRRRRLVDDCGLSEYTFASHAAESATLRQRHAADPRAQVLLDAVDDWRLRLQSALR